MRVCSVCELEKPLENFEKTAKFKDTRRRDCDQCRVKRLIAWRIKNPELNARTHYLWRINNPARCTAAMKAAQSNRRANKYSAPGKIFAQDLLNLFAAYYNICTYCGEFATTLDHIRPLSRGGTNYIENLAPCCKRCNTNKNGNILNKEWFSPMAVGLQYGNEL